MKPKYLIASVSLLLPIAAAQAQDAPQASSPAADTPAAEAPATDAPANEGQQSAAPASGGATVQAKPATDADLTKGAVVNDPAGKPVGTIESTSADGIVLAVGDKKFQIPKSS